jgi:16S rRNA processing protein RimM
MVEEFVIGLIGAPFGVEGRVKIRSLSGEFDHLLSLESVRLRLGEKIAEYRVEAVSASPPSIKLTGFDSPEAVKFLKGAEILSDRAHAAPLDSDEFYIEDLKGVDVFAPDRTGGKTQVGVISDVLEGSGFLVEITLASGVKRLVPFRSEFFGDVDVTAGKAELLVRWILDLDENAEDLEPAHSTNLSRAKRTDTELVRNGAWHQP